MKIVMCASEVVPFAKTGGLADVLGSLPLALEQTGHDVSVIMPGYPVVRTAKVKGYRACMRDVSRVTIGKKCKVYFVNHDFYFNRPGLYGDGNGDYSDNLDRFSFFSRRALEIIKALKVKPDIVHCHDWQTGLVPVYLKSLYASDPFFKKTRSVITIHNIGYQGIFHKEEFPKLGLDWGYFTMDRLEFYDTINLLKGGIVFSDVINTVSPTYSREILTEQFGFGLEGVLCNRKTDVYGILNGLDYSVWDPAKDEFIAQTYSVSDRGPKAASKRALQRFCGFAAKKTVPVIGIVSRLAQQKGFDIFSQIAEQVCAMDVQMVVLGSGDAKYQRMFEMLEQRFPGRVSVHTGFDDPLAHKIYAGSDLFLMPSYYEPCGLGQMIALKYGTLPIVYKTGGLADTVNAGNGFVFDNYTPSALLKAVSQALEVFKNRASWDAMVEYAMRCNFSWLESARHYERMYEKALLKKR